MRGLIVTPVAVRAAPNIPFHDSRLPKEVSFTPGKGIHQINRRLKKDNMGLSDFITPEREMYLTHQ
jgi:hypothetical protein